MKKNCNFFKIAPFFLQFSKRGNLVVHILGETKMLPPLKHLHRCYFSFKVSMSASNFWAILP